MSQWPSGTSNDLLKWHHAINFIFFVWFFRFMTRSFKACDSSCSYLSIDVYFNKCIKSSLSRDVSWMEFVFLMTCLSLSLSERHLQCAPYVRVDVSHLFYVMTNNCKKNPGSCFPIISRTFHYIRSRGRYGVLHRNDASTSLVHTFSEGVSVSLLRCWQQCFYGPFCHSVALENGCSRRHHKSLTDIQK